MTGTPVELVALYFTIISFIGGAYMTGKNQIFWSSALGAISSTRLNVKTSIIRTVKSAVRAKPLSLLQKNDRKIGRFCLYSLKYYV